MIERIALLFGLFAAPMILLQMGHGFRNLTGPARRRFWGGVLGHASGLLLTLLAILSPPVWWAGGPAARAFAVHWAMALGFLLGLVLGPPLGSALSRRRSRRDPP